jgi:surface carbohydrate biosynthesis protein
MSPPRLCLIVDHPARDLDGLVLLARELAARGAEVFLVPMYETQEVFLLRPDRVLVNYVRFANLEFLRTCRRLGIDVAVLDTEGGVVDLAAYRRDVAPYLPHVDRYLLWGLRQLEALRACPESRAVRLEVTGCPRYDYAVAPWKDALADPEPLDRPFVLLNTNFPSVDPRFQSAGKEAHQLVHGMGLPKDRVDDLFRQTEEVRARFLDVARELAAAFPSTPFVLRPHPFENPDVYRRAFEGLPNVRVRQEGAVFHWIRRAVAVVHHHCSTAVESFLMGVEPLMLSWIRAPLLEQAVSAAVSRHAGSLDELKAQIAEIRSGRPLPPSADLQARRDAVVRDWFFRNDGRAAARAAAALLDAPARPKPGRLTGALRLVLGRGRWTAALQALALLLLGSRAYCLLRAAATGPRDPAKRFDAPLVRRLLARLDAVAGTGPASSAEPAAPRHAWLPVPGPYSSVRVAPGGP